jgi:hypothetical protein
MTDKHETLYSARIAPRTNRLLLAKWDGHKAPVETYSITNGGRGTCDCQGSIRNPYCKHRQMVDKWLATGIGFHGNYYAFETGLIYCQEDNEGVPTIPFIANSREFPNWVGEEITPALLKTLMEGN